MAERGPLPDPFLASLEYDNPPPPKPPRRGCWGCLVLAGAVLVLSLEVAALILCRGGVQ